ncbi:hypothetical protein HPB49_023248 [Dermacentor silvarum]|uniref:Uncharacterized protein n=1 Tax=Dermacentor silvarum TaxID=543639 RepID=A0ACB8CC21_DERSI|nr:hypothetical protein HPB49_023248 [Dermacentor silvarum]
MKAWQARNFNGIESVILEETRVPQLASSNEVLVKVHAASVNPLDVAMLDIEKAKTKSHLESAALPYAGLTAWAGIRTVGNLTRYTTRNKRCLVLGASGGVGTFAVQLLKAWNGVVTATCSSGAVELVSKLGADTVVDYTAPDFEAQLLQGPRSASLQRAALCLETAKRGLKVYYKQLGRLSTYVTVVSPVLRNTDDMGLFSGMALSACQALQVTVKELVDGRSARWAFFCTNANALKEIAELVDLGKVTPVVSSTYSFLEVPAAYHKIKEGHARGKIVISVVEQESPVHKPQKPGLDIA